MEEVENHSVNHEKDIQELEARKLASYEKYKLGKMTRLDFIEEKKTLDKRIEALKTNQEKIEVQKENIQEKKLTRELMDKYVEKVIVRGTEILKIEWK